MSDGHSMDGGQFENDLARIPARKDIRRNPRSDTIGARNNRSIRRRASRPTARPTKREFSSSAAPASHRIASAISGSHNITVSSTIGHRRFKGEPSAPLRPGPCPSRREGREKGEISGSLE